MISVLIASMGRVSLADTLATAEGVVLVGPVLTRQHEHRIDVGRLFRVEAGLQRTLLVGAGFATGVVVVVAHAFTLIRGSRMPYRKSATRLAIMAKAPVIMM